MFGHLAIATIAGALALVPTAAAMPANVTMRDVGDVGSCLEAASWKMHWLGKPILLGDADPVGEFKGLIKSNQCDEVSCRVGTSDALKHSFADSKRLHETSYRIEIHEAWFHSQVMREVMAEVAGQGIAAASQWELKHWDHPASHDFLNAKMEKADSGDHWQMTLPGDQFTLTWQDVDACSSFRLKVRFIDTKNCGTWTLGATLGKVFSFGILGDVVDGGAVGSGVDTLKRMVNAGDKGSIEITTDLNQPKC